MAALPLFGELLQYCHLRAGIFENPERPSMSEINLVGRLASMEGACHWPEAIQLFVSPKGPRPHRHTATVAIRHDKDGDAQLNRPLEAWLKRRSGDWAVHYHGDDPQEREATFVFELEAERDLFVKWEAKR